MREKEKKREKERERVRERERKKERKKERERRVVYFRAVHFSTKFIVKSTM
jgi:glutamate/tyrosine decarboxylase-like PLP-dependent enzyme